MKRGLSPPDTALDNDHEIRTRAIPQRIGKYEIRGVVGKGGMGVVYRAYDSDIDRLVALKLLYPHLNDEGLALRFRQEARAAARCVHRNIVTVFDFGTIQDAPYMVMEYVDGIDLRSFLKAEGSVGLQESGEIVLQILAALEFAHAHGVVHRDIKPGNVLLLDDGLVKVTDFGVAKLDTSDLTSVGDMIGTPSYMSPEAHAGETVDGRSDLYAVGVVLLELLCGDKPKPHQPPQEEIGKLLRASPLEPAQQRDFQALFTTALAWEPAKRFQSAEAFSTALKQLLAPDVAYRPDTENLAATIVETKRQIRQATGAEPHAGPPTAAHDEEFSPSPEMTLHLRDALSPYLGPVTSYVIRAASKNCHTLDSLIVELAAKIPNPKERSEFVNALRNDGSAARTSASSLRSGADHGDPSGRSNPATGGTTAFPADLLDRLAQQLTGYLGPLAPRLVKRAAARAADLSQLYQLLAEHIDDPGERQWFLDNR